MMNRVLIICLVTLLSGCQSIIFTSSPDPKTKSDFLTSRELFCSTNYGWPTSDAINGALGTYFLSKQSDSNKLILAGTVAVSLISTIYGIMNVSDCRDAKKHRHQALKKQLQEMKILQRKIKDGK